MRASDVPAGAAKASAADLNSGIVKSRPGNRLDRAETVFQIGICSRSLTISDTDIGTIVERSHILVTSPMIHFADSKSSIAILARL